MVRLAGLQDPLIGRALALFDVVAPEAGSRKALDLVYLVHGKFTTALAQSAVGALVELWGPLGNGFAIQPVEHLVLVAGGIGYTPFLAVAKQHLGCQHYGPAATSAAPEKPPKITFCYGARTADMLASVGDFEALGVDVRLCTEDGSRGLRGRVTDVLQEVLQESTAKSLHVMCCGPEPMMEAVAKLSAKHQAPCEVSLETPMACGIGVCFSCVAPVRCETAPDGWDYQRTCVAGPVFNAADIVW